MKNNNSKFFFNTLMLLLAIMALIGVTYAYWTNLKKQNLGTVIIGEGTELLLDVTAQPENGKVLVPQGNALSDNEEESLTFAYTVKLSKKTTRDLNLSVSADNIKINDSADYANLVSIAVNAPAVINDAAAEVTVTVTLDEPADDAAYNAVINKPITFTLTFAATVPA